MTVTQFRYCYKVVNIDQSALQLTALCYRDVIYQIGEWTVPLEECGPLCVFDTLEHAKRFVYTAIDPWEYPNLAIYACLIEPSSLHEVWYKSKNQSNYRPLVSTAYLPNATAYLPNGTVLANKVQLIPGGLKAHRGGDFCLKDAICGYEKL